MTTTLPTRTDPVMTTTTRRPAALIWAGIAALGYLLLMAWVVTIAGQRFTDTASTTLVAVLSAALLVPLIRRLPLLALGWLLVVSGAAVAGGHSSALIYVQFVVCAAVVGAIASMRPRRMSIPAAVVTLLVLAGLAPLNNNGSNTLINTTVLGILLVATAWTVGYTVRERREHSAAIRVQAAHQAVADERLRIARELHDVVAHSIGVIAIQAGAGRRVIKTQPDQAEKALEVIESTSRETLGGLRRTLGTLRGTDPQAAPLEPTPGLADTDRLVRSTGDAGVRVDLRQLGDPRAVPADVDASAYRIVQEALTNVVRHSGATECEVTIDFRAEDLYLEITDQGTGPHHPGAGYGIVGMRERVALLHGDFIAGPRPEGGFRVAARLPLPVTSLPVTSLPAAPMPGAPR